MTMMMNPVNDLRRLGCRSLIGAAMLGLAFAAASGCAASSKSDGDAARTASPGVTGRTAPATHYLVEPTMARDFGYRVTWSLPGQARGTVRGASLAGDSLFMIDARNNLTRIVRETGARTWTWPVGAATDEVKGVVRGVIGDTEVVLVLTEGDIHIFDVPNGSQLDRQRLRQRVAATAPIVRGDMLIYGSANGQIVWHHFGLRSYARGNTLRGAISAPPTTHGNLLVAVSDTGQVMALDAVSGVSLWVQSTRDPIVAPAAVTEDAVYVTSRDQYIYCYDARTGRVMWRRLHGAPLTEPPVVVGDNVYVQTPDLGLTCYEAFPINRMDGNLRWNNRDVSGTVIGRHAGNLLVWDGRSRTLTTVDQRRGDVVDAFSLPGVKQLRIDDFDSGEILVIGDSGEVSRLVPRT